MQPITRNFTVHLKNGDVGLGERQVFSSCRGKSGKDRMFFFRIPMEHS